MIQDKNGKWRLTAADIRIGPDDMETDVENSCISASIQSWFDVDARFGTETYGMDDYINLYADFNPFLHNFELYYFIHYANGNVSDAVYVEDVSAEERNTILSLMREAGLDKLRDEYETEMGRPTGHNDEKLYLLFTCDDWKSRDSMRVLETVKGYDMLLAVVTNEVFEGDMQYKGLTKKDGVLALIRDYEAGRVALDAIGNGFVRLIGEEMLELDNAPDDYRMAYDWLNMGEAEFMSLVSSVEAQAE
ncbi:MAG: hypothetical protein LBQ48_03140, partial [Oscillospiraceae bacterium]|nr:hypothetical protein [Oscillospiraceae bacterium]